MLGDFNARVKDGHDIWFNCFGHFGTGKMNKNRQTAEIIWLSQAICSQQFL